MQLQLDHYDSPLGIILLMTDGEGALRALDFADHEARMRRLLRLHYGSVEPRQGVPPRAIMRALDAYFAGDWNAINGLVVRTAGTPFQRAVWEALRKIPAGQPISYGQLAARLGRPAASRAVGAANGANPVAIVVPCHRVIGADGSLTGYGGSLPRKRWLLDHECGGVGASVAQGAGEIVTGMSLT